MVEFLQTHMEDATMPNTASLLVEGPEWERLVTIWLEEKKPALMQVGHITYEVATPDGQDSPVFIAKGNEQGMYSSTSFISGGKVRK